VHNFPGTDEAARHEDTFGRGSMAVRLFCTTDKLLASAKTERRLLGRRAWIVVTILTKVSSAYYFNLPLTTSRHSSLSVRIGLCGTRP
jgi:hypothetical protein